MTPLRTGAALAAALALLAPAAAVGQAQTTPGLASDQPIDITADALEVYRDQRLTVFKGNVEAIQGNVRIRSPQLNLYSGERAPTKPGQPAPTVGPGSNFGDIERLEAAGPVYYITPTQQAKGDKAIYEKAPDTITLLGNVVVTQDKNVVAGDKLVIEQKTGRSTLISNVQGTNAPKRVRGVFYPAAQTPPGAPPAAAPAAAKPAAPAKAARKTKAKAAAKPKGT